MECFKATQADLANIFANVHDTWPHDAILDIHTRKRLSSAQHKHAQWYYGRYKGKIVTSLGLYAYKFMINSNVVNGAAIGAVHTVKQFRRRGFAQLLFQYVHSQALKSGYEMILLFSDIGTYYYEKLGYTPIDIRHGSINKQKHPDDQWTQLKVNPMDLPASEGLKNQVYRDDTHWQWLLDRYDELTCLRCQRDGLDVTMICGMYEDRFNLLSLHGQVEDSEMQALLSSCADYCNQEKIFYWLDKDIKGLRMHAPKKELPMVCFLNKELETSKPWQLQTIDHV